MTFDEYIAFLEPQLADPSKNLTARGGAICQSASDWNKLKTSLEQACKILGNNCSFEIKTSIDQLGATINKLQTNSLNKKVNFNARAK